jgi:hypothetical protein
MAIHLKIAKISKKAKVKVKVKKNMKNGLN